MNTMSTTEKIELKIASEKYSEDNYKSLVRSIDFDIDYILSELDIPDFNEATESWIKRVNNESFVDSIKNGLRCAFLSGYELAKKKGVDYGK